LIMIVSIALSAFAQFWILRQTRSPATQAPR
jgi:hypothetical protein